MHKTILKMFFTNDIFDTDDKESQNFVLLGQRTSKPTLGPLDAFGLKLKHTG